VLGAITEAPFGAGTAVAPDPYSDPAGAVHPGVPAGATTEGPGAAIAGVPGTMPGTTPNAAGDGAGAYTLPGIVESPGSATDVGGVPPESIGVEN
jgi:hypothetical protein